MVEPDTPLTISGDAGSWRFDHDGQTGLYAATFQPAAVGGAVRGQEWSTRTFSSWALEAEIGFPLPVAAHHYLTQATTVSSPFGPGSEIGGRPPAGSRAARHHQMRFGGHDSTYGRTMHTHPPDYTWANGAYRIDILEIAQTAWLRPPSPSPDGEDADGRSLPEEVEMVTYAYRLSYEGRVISARADFAVPRDLPLSGTLLVKIAAERFLRDDPRTQRETEWFAAHTDSLRRLTSLPFDPYPPGTRVRVQVGGYRAPATGTVVDAHYDPEGKLTHYSWRPDHFDQPGHRFADQPNRVVISDEPNVVSTLDPPDLDTRLLAYGARVATIDDPTIEGGTVLRTQAYGDGHALLCEVQPDTPGSAPVWRAEGDLTVLAGALYSTAEELIAARARDGLPLMPGEPLLAVRTMSATYPNAAGIPTALPGMSTGLRDPLLAPDTHHPSARFQLAPAPATAGGYLLTPSPEGMLLAHPDHGIFTVPTARFTAARALSPEVLRTLLTGHQPTVPLPDPPPEPGAGRADADAILAALAAAYLPSLPDPTPPPPKPGSPSL